MKENDYEIEKVIGKGVTSKVYKCLHKKTNKYYALKEISKDLIYKCCLQEQLDREINIMKTLEHPNLVKCVDSYENEDFYNIIMPYCPDGNMGEYLQKKKKLRGVQLKIVFKQIRDCYKYLFERKFMHRDIKPQNILIVNEFDMDIKIGDFGSSREGDVGITIVGTKTYSAPELENDVTNYNYKADLYSIGLCFWMFMFGNKYYPFNSQTLESLKNDKLNSTLDNLPFPDDKVIDPVVKNFFFSILNPNPDFRMDSGTFFTHKIFEMDFIDDSSDSEDESLNENERSLNFSDINFQIKFDNDYSFLDQSQIEEIPMDYTLNSNNSLLFSKKLDFTLDGNKSQRRKTENFGFNKKKNPEIHQNEISLLISQIDYKKTIKKKIIDNEKIDKIQEIFLKNDVVNLYNEEFLVNKIGTKFVKDIHRLFQDSKTIKKNELKNLLCLRLALLDKIKMRIFKICKSLKKNDNFLSIFGYDFFKMDKFAVEYQIEKYNKFYKKIQSFISKNYKMINDLEKDDKKLKKINDLFFSKNKKLNKNKAKRNYIVILVQFLGKILKKSGIKNYGVILKKLKMIFCGKVKENLNIFINKDLNQL